MKTLATLEYRYGSYILKLDYFENDAQATMYDISKLRFPLLWSTRLTKPQAHGAKTLFETIGYFDMPV